MQYRTYKETMLPQMVRLWKEEAVRIRYKAYDSPEEWKAELLDKPDFDPEGCILAFTDSGSLAGFAAAISQKEFLPGQNRDNTPGYIFLLVVKEEYEGRGVGSSLLEKAEAFLKGQGKHEIRISHKCPIKMSWYIDREGHEHNKAPGIRTDSPGYIFFQSRGYELVQKEISYYLELEKFYIPADVQKHIMELESEGIRVAWFDSAGNFGYEEMFERLKDQSFLKKFRDGIREHKKILIVEDRDGRVMGTAGTVYPEKNGRGFFSALAVDPADGGRGIGNVLFFSLCQELKNMGAEYMTIFVTETNFARRIYEKAGFSAVQEWAILKKTV